jgi:YgiT-type zinc finger domain-containing protein
MKCPICKYGKIENGFAIVILGANKATLVFKNVPADICNNCGEEFINKSISAELISLAKQAVEAGVQVDVREYLSPL